MLKLIKILFEGESTTLTCLAIRATYNYRNLSFTDISEVYLEYWQLSKMEVFTKIPNEFMPINYFR